MPLAHPAIDFLYIPSIDLVLLLRLLFLLIDCQKNNFWRFIYSLKKKLSIFQKSYQVRATKNETDWRVNADQFAIGETIKTQNFFQIFQLFEKNRSEKFYFITCLFIYFIYFCKSATCRTPAKNHQNYWKKAYIF